jgi:TRAP-type C4-dicarboxylate transport system permease small subunit
MSSGLLARMAAAAVAIAGAALIALALVEAWQVFARYVLDSPPGWTEPVALLCLKTALMLGAAVGVRTNAHFRIVLGLDAAGPRIRAALEALTQLTAAALGLALAVWGTQMTIANWPIKAPGAPLSYGLYFAPFVVGGLLIALFACERLALVRRTPSRTRPSATPEPAVTRGAE